MKIHINNVYLNILLPPNCMHACILYYAGNMNYEMDDTRSSCKTGVINTHKT